MQEEQWGDFRDWESWQARNAALIAQDICARNGGQWPVSVAEWTRAAARYGLVLMVVREPISAPAQRLDNLIVVRFTRRASVLARRICHEIAEAVALRDSGLRQFQFQSNVDEFHRVAQLVEAENTRLVEDRLAESKRRAAALERRLQRLQAALDAERASIAAGEEALAD